MFMGKKISLSIPKPCHENWDAMTPVEKGRFCGSCEKQVIDFSKMTDRQVAEFFKKPSTGSVCGRFMNDQLGRDFEIPKKRIPWLKYFFQIALPAFFISKASAQHQKMGMVLSRPITKDTVQKPPVREPMLMGKVANHVCTQPLTGTIAIVGDTTIVRQPDKVDKIIKGIVTNEKGEPVPFAMIKAGGVMNILFANEKGEFSVKSSFLKDEQVLLVSSSGYEDKEITVDLSSEFIEIKLKANDSISEGGVSSSQHFLLGEITVANPARDTTPPDTAIINDIIVQRDIPLPPDRNKFYVYPNPVLSGSNLSVGVHLLEEGYYNCQFLDLSGQLIQQKEIWIDADARLLNIDVPTVAAGNYLFVLTNRRTGKRFTEKLIIQ